jgi:hypothetical protein
MALFKIQVRLSDKEVVFYAKELDMTHPYFVSIKNLVFQNESVLLINPAENEIYKKFKNSKNIMFPVQSVLLIEEVPEDSIISNNLIIEKIPKNI